MEITTILLPPKNSSKKFTFASIEYNEVCHYQKLLTETELLIVENFGSEKRKREFLAGRIAAKLALSKFTDASQITITNDNNGAPVVSDTEFTVSISHSGNTAVAIASNHDMPFGVDIQCLRPKSIAATKRLTPEKCVSREITHLTAAWALKEALSKCLKTGFTVPYNEFLLKSFVETQNKFECTFEKYSRYYGKAIFNGGYFLAIVGPKTCVDKIEIGDFL
ncbi:MAG: 4'-phosphopantetheinyl transferase superfamily protein [Alphaproteobacteria bacterium]|nr:4'-phosphopantetheinyl transferase superfamily protein [Alphaproteobacteria bacterium]